MDKILSRPFRMAVEERQKRALSLDRCCDSAAYKARVVARRLGAPGPISPGDYFTVNNAAFMSTCAAVCTYLIVLLQFKTTIN